MKKLSQAMIVYRLEMPDGDGPWAHGERNRPWAERLCGCNCPVYRGQPCWDCDSLAAANNESMDYTGSAFYARHGDAHYGVDSLDAMRAWFPEGARAFLKEKGAAVIKYEVPAGGEVQVVGHGEVIFSKKEAKVDAKLDPVALA